MQRVDRLIFPPRFLFVPETMQGNAANLLN
jgi:hypothetical protein